MRLLVMLLWTLAGGQGVDAPLAPAGKWQVDYAENRCTLARTFGEGERTVSLGLMPLTGGGEVKIAMIARDRTLFRGEGEATVTVVPSASKEGRTVSYYSTADPSGGSAAYVGWGRPGMSELAQATMLTIRHDSRAVTFEMRGIARALEALAACERNLAKTWGFDPEQVATPPKLLNGAELVRNNDYPRDALREGRSGQTGFRLRVGIDGKPTDCVIVESSGSADFDKSACTIALSRARFQPALDKDGKPIPALFASSIRWLSWPA